jgi:hypothetical protein
MPIQDEYIVAGATMSCSGSQIPYPGSSSIFKCTNPIHKIQSKDVGTTVHEIPVINVPPFGICAILTAAAAGVPTTCVPFPAGWQKPFNGLVSSGNKVLLLSSYSKCVFNGLIQFRTSGQISAAINQAHLPLPAQPGQGAVNPALPAQPGQGAINQVNLAPPAQPSQGANTPGDMPAAPPLPTPLRINDELFVLAPGDSTATWNHELNGVPLKDNARYLVGKYLYRTDDEGRVKEARGVLELKTRPRNKYQQGKAPSDKNGELNPHHRQDRRTAIQKQEYLANGQPNPQYKKRKKKEIRRFIDDGGHLIGAQFNGPGEQINYVPMHKSLNQSVTGQDNWYKMESDWADYMNPPIPSNRNIPRAQKKQIFLKMLPQYPNGSIQGGSSLNGHSMRPNMIQVKYWVDEEKNVKTFYNQ